MPRRPSIPAAALALLFVALAGWQIGRPGLYYDEALFINAATGARGDADFVYARLGRVPLLLLPYLGALKAHLFAPVFALLGTSVETVRLPWSRCRRSPWCSTFFACGGWSRPRWRSLAPSPSSSIRRSCSPRGSTGVRSP